MPNYYRSLSLSKILEVLQNLPDDQSDCEATKEERHILHLDSGSEESDYNITQNSDSSSDDDHTYSDSDDSVPLSTLRSANLRRGRGRGRGRGRSRGHRGRGTRIHTEIIHHNTDVEVSSTGISWTPENLSVLNQPGCRPRQNILTEEAGPTSFAKRCYKGGILSAWILSSLYSNVFVDPEEAKKKPNTVKFYNTTKFGVDVIDQMAKKYSVKAPSHCWPVQVFYNILDLAAINFWILYKKLSQKKISRKKYILDLARELVGQDTHSLITPSTLQPDNSIPPEPLEERSGNGVTYTNAKTKPINLVLVVKSLCVALVM